MNSSLDLNPFGSHRVQRIRSAAGVRSACRWELIEGCPIAVEDVTGEPWETQPIVCLHDAGSGGREFRPLIGRRPPGSRLVLIDWPGHGRSGDLSGPSFSIDHCVSILSQFLKRWRIRRPVLAGSGFGAAVAIQFAAANPSSVLGLVLCRPWGLFRATLSEPAKRQPRAFRRRFLAMARMFPTTFLRSGTKERPGPKWQRLRTAATASLLQPVVAQATASMLPWEPEIAAALRSLPCPALFALSKNDPGYPLKKALSALSLVLASMPQRRVAVIDGSFHPLWDDPQRFSFAISSFLQELLPVERHQHAWLLAAVDWPAADTNLWKCAHPECGEERVLASGRDANNDV